MLQLEIHPQVFQSATVQRQYIKVGLILSKKNYINPNRTCLLLEDAVLKLSLCVTFLKKTALILLDLKGY